MDVRQRFRELKDIPPFPSKFTDPSVARTAEMDVLQINIGRLCNLACNHCHLECGPHRTEIMSEEVMEACLKACSNWGFKTVDITGGAPEMNPHFRWFADECCRICDHVIVRSNMVIMLEDGYTDMPEFYAKNGIELFVSLPHYKSRTTDRQRGANVFDRSIEVLKRLNSAGYGRDPGLVLNMVFNPAGAFLPPDQTSMELEYKRSLKRDYDIDFNNLFCLTNNPIGRFGEALERTGNFESYMHKLYDAFNPATLEGMMCRTQISVGWDGSVYDCDFNQAAGMRITGRDTIFDIAQKPYRRRVIVFDKHCYACTAGPGSS